MESSTTSSSRKRFYPLFLSLNGRECLVVGGGSVGERKVRRLMDYGARIIVLAGRLTPWLQDQVAKGQVALLSGPYHPEALDGMLLVFAATNDRILNRRIAEDARARGIWCNMATDPDFGDFILPAVYEQGSLCIAVSTGGLSPGVAKIIREQFERDFGPEWVAALDFLGRLRMAIKDLGLSESENQRIFRGLAALSVQDRVSGQDPEEMLEAVAMVCRPQLDMEQIRALWENSWKRLS
jgi:precorrin-2 dehydrogenase/sirohydrochlorin ferrochelatase